MDSSKIGKVSVEILEFVAGISPQLDGAEKLAALKSAASILENVQAQEVMSAALAANFQNLLGGKPR